MFGFEKPRTPAAPSERLLPSDVRYALKYREANLNPSEVLDLARNGFEREGLYLALKGLKDDPDAQLEALGRIAARASDTDRPVSLEDIGSEIERIAPALPKDVAVAGMKLAQLSRQGFEFWHERYRDSAERYAADPDATFIVGHSMFVGLADFVAAHAKAGKRLHVLMPDFIEEPGSTHAGYRIEGGTASFLEKDFERGAHAIVIDDVLNTGKTTAFLKDFWTEGGKHEAPRFEYLAIGGPGA